MTETETEHLISNILKTAVNYTDCLLRISHYIDYDQLKPVLLKFPHMTFTIDLLLTINQQYNDAINAIFKDIISFCKYSVCIGRYYVAPEKHILNIIHDYGLQNLNGFIISGDTNDYGGISIINNIIRGSPVLESFTLNIHISEPDLLILLYTISHKSSLQSFSITGSAITQKSFEALCQCLSCLQIVEFRYSMNTRDIINHHSRLVTSLPSTITHFSIYNTIDEFDIPKILKFLPSLQLHDLHIGYIHNVDIFDLIEFIRQNKTIQTLNINELTCHNASTDSIDALWQMLSYDINLLRCKLPITGLNLNKINNTDSNKLLLKYGITNCISTAIDVLHTYTRGDPANITSHREILRLIAKCIYSTRYHNAWKK